MTPPDALASGISSELLCNSGGALEEQTLALWTCGLRLSEPLWLGVPAFFVIGGAQKAATWDLLGSNMLRPVGVCRDAERGVDAATSCWPLGSTLGAERVEVSKATTRPGTWPGAGAAARLDGRNGTRPALVCTLDSAKGGPRPAAADVADIP